MNIKVAAFTVNEKSNYTQHIMYIRPIVPNKYNSGGIPERCFYLKVDFRTKSVDDKIMQFYR